jgi:hypothetical protein
MIAESIRRNSFPHALALTKGITTEGSFTPIPPNPMKLRCPEANREYVANS